MSFLQGVQTALGSTKNPVPVASRAVPGVKRPERDAGHSSPTSAEVGCKESPMFTAPYAFIMWTGRTLPLYNPHPHPNPHHNTQSRFGKLQWAQLQYLNP